MPKPTENEIKRFDNLVKFDKLLDTIEDPVEKQKIIQCEIKLRKIERQNATESS